MRKISLLALLFCNVTFADTVNLNAQTFPTDCKLSHRCDLHGSHDISIINDTDQNHYYTYSYQLYTEDGQSYVVSNGVWVGFHSQWLNHHDSHLTARLEYIGKHIVTAKTTVNGFVNQERTDSKYVNVTK